MILVNLGCALCGTANNRTPLPIITSHRNRPQFRSLAALLLILIVAREWGTSDPRLGVKEPQNSSDESSQSYTDLDLRVALESNPIPMQKPRRTVSFSIGSFETTCASGDSSRPDWSRTTTPNGMHPSLRPGCARGPSFRHVVAVRRINHTDLPRNEILVLLAGLRLIWLCTFLEE